MVAESDVVCYTHDIYTKQDENECKDERNNNLNKYQYRFGLKLRKFWFCMVFIGFFFRYRTIQDPASQRLTWYKPPLTVLVIKKVRDASILPPFVQLVNWLIQVNI